MAETPTGAQFLGIAEVAARTGLSQDTLRWYEREGVLPPVTRTSDGRRSYDEAALGHDRTHCSASAHRNACG